MAKKRVAGAVKTPKSDVEIILDIAIRKHAKHPDLIKEIERILWEFQKRELSGEMLDRHAALQQFSREIGRVGVPNPLGPKDPGPKRGPIKGTGNRRKVVHQASGAPKRRKKRTPLKHRPSKKIYVN